MAEANIDLRRLRYFVAVARASGFRQAAAELKMAQPPLSQQVMALERQLGQRLFIRHPRAVELTPAGHALLAEAEPLLARAAEIPERIRLAAEGRSGLLRLGFTPALAHHPLLPRILRGFAARVPGITLRLNEHHTEALCQGILDGRLQAAFMRVPMPAPAGLLVEEIDTEPMLVALPDTHALAGRHALRLAELADEAFVMFERRLAPGLYDAVVAACLRAGFPMRVAHHAPQKVSALLMVASGLGPAILPASLAGMHAQAVRMIPIEGPQPVAAVALATRADEASTLAVRLRRFCAETAPAGQATSTARE